MSEMTPERLNEITRQCQLAKNGEADYPSQEELREALAALRNTRHSSATAQQKKQAKKDSLPSDLNDLFN